MSSDAPTRAREHAWYLGHSIWLRSPSDSKRKCCLEKLQSQTLLKKGQMLMLKMLNSEMICSKLSRKVDFSQKVEHERSYFLREAFGFPETNGSAKLVV